MQQIMASIIIRKTVEIKKTFQTKVTNLAKSKQYTAEHGTLVLQIHMLNFFLRLRDRSYNLNRGVDMHIGRGCEECERPLPFNFGKKQKKNQIQTQYLGILRLYDLKT